MKPQEGKHETLKDMGYGLLATLILHQMRHVEPFTKCLIVMIHGVPHGNHMKPSPRELG